VAINNFLFYTKWAYNPLATKRIQENKICLSCMCTKTQSINNRSVVCWTHARALEICKEWNPNSTNYNTLIQTETKLQNVINFKYVSLDIQETGVLLLKKSNFVWLQHQLTQVILLSLSNCGIPCLMVLTLGEGI
jgi:hypothetical protein